MADTGRHAHGCRRRLTAAFVLIAAVSSGALALLTYEVASRYRTRSFQQTSENEARVALALAPEQLDEQGFQRLVRTYDKRTGTDVVASVDGRTLTTSTVLSFDDLPVALQASASGDPVGAEAVVDGRSEYVVVGQGPGGARYAFLFSLDQLRAGLDELRTILIAAWVAVVAVALAVGHLVSRRTLRPVREAAEAATALSNGLLHTRLPTAGDDEFGTWATSFNSMAAALEAKIDELAAAAERERRFTADVSHDLRTPLTSLAATATVLEEQLDELPEPARRAVAVMVGDVVRLRDLVLELLELARLDAGEELGQPEPLRVEAAVQATLDGQARTRTLRCHVDVPSGLQVLAERARLRRILGNVIGNAAAHGASQVWVAASADGEEVRIVVSDDGPGIPVRDLERIFDRFFKSDRSRASGGSGLGLAIAREHARAMGGDLVAGNEPGRGARFVLTLPGVPGVVAANRRAAAPGDDPVAVTER